MGIPLTQDQVEQDDHVDEGETVERDVNEAFLALELRLDAVRGRLDLP